MSPLEEAYSHLGAASVDTGTSDVALLLATAQVYATLELAEQQRRAADALEEFVHAAMGDVPPRFRTMGMTP